MMLKSLARSVVVVVVFVIGLFACDGGGHSSENTAEITESLPLASRRGLNDTGITQCSDNLTAGISCPVTGYPNQDGQVGRDFIDNDDSDGYSGFSFTKLDTDGNVLLPNAADWSCVKDNVTNLIWEVKQSGNGIVGEGLHDADDGYNWYSTDTSNNGGFAGYQDQNSSADGNSCSTWDDGVICCYGYDVANASSLCNTRAFTSRVNSQSLCGASDWRLPTREELHSILNYGQRSSSSTLKIDTDYFPQRPQTQGRWAWTWTSTPFAYEEPTSAWAISFAASELSGSHKSAYNHIRLVRVGE